MINVYIRKSGCFNEIEARGHAEYAPIGQDIVCSAFSMLIYTLLSYFDKYPEKARVYKDRVSSGNICIGFNSLHNDIDVVFECVLNGLLVLSEQYPNNIVIHGNYSESK